jgi:hypothetical protein
MPWGWVVIWHQKQDRHWDSHQPAVMFRSLTVIQHEEQVGDLCSHGQLSFPRLRGVGLGTGTEIDVGLKQRLVGRQSL